MRNKWIWLIMITGFLLRVIVLDKFPVGFTPDEASFGFDAYSILKTGKDQWGDSFPLVLKSFGDFKPPLYAYLTVPFVWLFGLTKTAVRLPNALFGVAAIISTYFLVKGLFKNSKHKHFPLVTSFLLAVSPWHTMLSRGAFEANLTTFLMPTAIYLYLKAKGNKKLYIYSAVLFGLNLFSYHSAKLVTPVVVVALLLIFETDEVTLKRITNLFRKRSHFIAVFSVFLIITAFTFISGAGERVQEVSVLKSALSSASLDRTRSILGGTQAGLAKLLHNKYQVATRQFVTNYLNYFSPHFLFSSGPGEATYGMIPGRGVLYWFELPAILAFFMLLFKKRLGKGVKLILIWLLASPVPAALSTGPGFAANRAAIIMPALQIVSALGFLWLYKEGKRLFGSFSVLYSLLGVFLVVVFLGAFIEDYFLLSPRKVAKGMLSGNLEAAYWLGENKGDKKVIVSRGLSEPHIYFAFAEKINPKLYQEYSVNWSYEKYDVDWVDQIPQYELGDYVFRDIHYQEFVNKKDILLVGRPNDFPETANVIKSFEYPDFTPAIYIVDPKTKAYAKNSR